MKFEHAITVRSQPGKNSDCGRALERAAFFPGVTEANLIEQDRDSVTIGYNGHESPQCARKFRAELDAEGLMADGELWDSRRLFGGVAASNVLGLFCRQTWHGHFQNKHLPRDRLPRCRLPGP